MSLSKIIRSVVDRGQQNLLFIIFKLDFTLNVHLTQAIIQSIIEFLQSRWQAEIKKLLPNSALLVAYGIHKVGVVTVDLRIVQSPISVQNANSKVDNIQINIIFKWPEEWTKCEEVEIHWPTQSVNKA